MTRVYFLALRCLHLGPLPCTRELVSINQHADHLRRAAGSLDEPASTPQQRMAQQQLLSLQRRMLVTETQLLDDALMQPLLRLCTLTAGLLRRHLGDPTAPRSGEDTQSGSPRCVYGGAVESALPAHPLCPAPCSLPLARPDAPSLLFLPEHIVGDWAEALLFLGQAQTVAFDEADAEGLLDFVVAVLASPHLVHSPHLRAKFGEVCSPLSALMTTLCSLRAPHTAVVPSLHSARGQRAAAGPPARAPRQHPRAGRPGRQRARAATPHAVPGRAVRRRGAHGLCVACCGCLLDLLSLTVGPRSL